MNLTAFLPALSSNIIYIYFDVPFSQKFHAALPNRSLEKSRKISTSFFLYIYISSFLYVNVQVRWDDHSIVPLDSSIHHT